MIISIPTGALGLKSEPILPLPVQFSPTYIVNEQLVIVNNVITVDFARGPPVSRSVLAHAQSVRVLKVG